MPLLLLCVNWDSDVSCFWYIGIRLQSRQRPLLKRCLEIIFERDWCREHQEVRVFPLSNWTETDIWQYIRREKIEIPSLYFAKVRPVVYRDGNIIMVDDDRMKLRPGEKIEHKSVRFRTLGCYPLTGGCESTATTLDEIIDETLSAVSSERTTRVIDNEAAGSMERRKREGYF